MDVEAFPKSGDPLTLRQVAAIALAILVAAVLAIDFGAPAIASTIRHVAAACNAEPSCSEPRSLAGDLLLLVLRAIL